MDFQYQSTYVNGATLLSYRSWRTDVHMDSRMTTKFFQAFDVARAHSAHSVRSECLSVCKYSVHFTLESTTFVLH